MTQPVAALFKDDKKFWRMRSRRYNKLQWARNQGYLHFFLHLGRFSKKDSVLDIGTGTGIIAHSVAPKVSQVTGIDISPQMLVQAREKAHANETFLQGDVHALEFPNDYFSRITARMVFHHVVKDSRQAIKECHRVLKPGGLMLLSEGVPPSKRVKPFYVKIFKLKENRLTFFEEDLVGLMKAGGFKSVESKVYRSRKMSINNWLKNSGLPDAVQKKIFDLHLGLSKEGQKDYNMKITADDCIIDMKFVVVIGKK